MPGASVVLVALQFAAIAALLWPWTAARFAAVGWVPIGFAAAVAIWTLAHNRPGNFNVFPEPLERARLVTTGPYAFVRHPMYVALLLAAAGCTIGWRTPFHVAATCALAWTLALKARREERLLVERFPGYADYASRTPRFLPLRRR